jgi:predicted metallopeptidase
MKFEKDVLLTEKVLDIIKKLGMSHVDFSRVVVLRSHGSKARRTIARCYALSKIWQNAFGIKAHYIIEVISERFDSLSHEEKEKVLIHELMHIPKSMGGGFKHHGNWVTLEHVNKMHRYYKQFSRQ